MYQISDVLELITAVNPKSVLDVGMGYGKYGYLTREYLDENYLRSHGKTKGLRIDGVEGHEQYVNTVQKFIYNEVFIGNVHELLPGFNHKYDLVLLLDVLEHFEQEDGERFIAEVLDKHGALLLSTPKYVGRQHDAENEFQEHLSQWSRRDLRSFGHVLFIPDAISHIALLSTDPAIIAQSRKTIKSRKLKHRLATIPGVNFIYRRFFWDDSILE